jgi:hypothetical protein
MRYTTLHLDITYVDMTVHPSDTVVSEDEMNGKKRKRYYPEVVKDDSGMIMCTSKAKYNYSKIVFIPETHPAFNGGMFVNSTIKGGRRREKITKVLTNIVKRAFFS